MGLETTVRISDVAKIFFFSNLTWFRLVLESTQPPIQYTLRSFFYDSKVIVVGIYWRDQDRVNFSINTPQIFGLWYLIKYRKNFSFT